MRLFTSLFFCVSFLGQIFGYSFLSETIAQSTDVEYKAEKFIREVRNSQNTMYNDVLGFYEDLLAKEPSVYIKIEKCRFIEKVFFDDEEYYNPKYEDFDKCLDELKNNFPNEPDAQIFYFYNQYGDSAASKLESFISDYASGLIGREPSFISLAYEFLARHYSNKEAYGTALAYATDAMKANDTLDLSALKAEQYIALDNFKAAKNILIEHIDSTDTENLYQKGSLFTDIEEFNWALKVFFWLEDAEDGWDVSEEIGDLLVKLERFDEARPYLLQASNTYWGKRKALENLFIFDLEHSSEDSVLSTYNLMRNEGFWADPFGIFKLKMIFERGVYGFQLRDLLTILSYLLLVFFLMISPYFWIVPVYAYGKWKYNDIHTRETFDTRWSLKHFWIISIVILAANFFTEIFINYSDFIANFNDEFIAEEFSTSRVLANSMLFFDLILVLGTVFLLKISDLKSFIGKKEQIGKEIALGVSSVFALRILYNLFFGLEGSLNGYISDASTGYLEQAILSLIEYYGSFIAFFSVVIIAPIIEEIQFRGIILGSASRYIPFWSANILQAILFGLIHADLNLFPFYLTFGLIAGFLRKNTNGYLAPITFHFINNLMAFMAILLLN